MCVAAIISKAVPLADLEEMESSNPHGGGVGWAQNGAMHWKKGLTAKEIFAMQEAGEITYPYLLHFRWATQGEICAELTHPFPLGVQALFPTTEGTAKNLLIHNGTWTPFISHEERAHIPDGLFDSLSDTAIAAYLAEDDPFILRYVQWATAVGSVGEDGTMVTECQGTWYPYEGNSYSNLTWQPSKSFSNWRFFNDDEGKRPYKDWTKSDYKSGTSKDGYKPNYREDYEIVKHDGEIISWDAWAKLDYPAVSEVRQKRLTKTQKEFTEEEWDARVRDSACRACKFYVCTCATPHPFEALDTFEELNRKGHLSSELAVMAASRPEELDGIIEAVIAAASGRWSIADDYATKLMDYMSDEQWKRFVARRFPDVDETEEDLVSDDPEVVNDYLRANQRQAG